MSVKTQQKEMQTATLELGPCMCNLILPKAFIADSISVVNTEQIELDIASVRETLADASAGIDKMRQELRSLADKVAKGEVRT